PGVHVGGQDRLVLLGPLAAEELLQLVGAPADLRPDQDPPLLPLDLQDDVLADLDLFGRGAPGGGLAGRLAGARLVLVAAQSERGEQEGGGQTAERACGAHTARITAASAGEKEKTATGERLMTWIRTVPPEQAGPELKACYNAV